MAETLENYFLAKELKEIKKELEKQSELFTSIYKK